MTHDELLEKLLNAYAGPIYHGLRAVVKLHKPFTGNTLELCYECMQLRKVDDPVITYPCRTIRAIEEELV